ncbi:regulatory protein, LacI [Roseibium sp. TrichSKD4]|nr:regulatory protein, LacI [Roseibium sp. TrichSKD4]
MLVEQVNVLGTKQAVADKMGVSRAAVSLYLSGRYGTIGGRNDHFEAKALAAFSDRVNCPHLGFDIEKEACAEHASAAQPMSDAGALRLWIACRACPLNPHAKSKGEAS